MKKPWSDVPPDVAREISVLIYSGNKIGAIKRYREAIICDLVDAKEAIEAYTDQLKSTNPGLFQESRNKGGKRIAAFLGVVMLGVMVSNAIPEAFKNEWQEQFETLLQTVKQKLTNSPDPITVVKPKQFVDHETPYEPRAPANPKADLRTLYQQKLANPEFLAWKNQQGFPSGYQDFIEEHYIKYVRAEINKHLILPDNTATLTIPVIPSAMIAIDGAIQHQEWRQAARIRLEPEESASVLYMQADQNWLYLAVDVPGDTTREGFDQFRFYIHVDTDPAIKNERIHVGGGTLEALGGIRETRVSWQGEAPKNAREGWKKHPLTDWRIYRLAMGASSMEQHRQFEAKLNLKESGLTIGSPFPAFVEVETDPRQEGKSRTRMYLGKLGNQNRPVWLIMQ